MTVAQIAFARALELNELQNAEIMRWRVILNEDLSDFQWEVCRDDDAGTPIMVLGCRTEPIAWHERDEQAAAAGIRAVLAAVQR